MTFGRSAFSMSTAQANFEFSGRARHSRCFSPEVPKAHRAHPRSCPPVCQSHSQVGMDSCRVQIIEPKRRLSGKCPSFGPSFLAIDAPRARAIRRTKCPVGSGSFPSCVNVSWPDRTNVLLRISRCARANVSRVRSAAMAAMSHALRDRHSVVGGFCKSDD
jgi:hypothetical protein